MNDTKNDFDLLVIGAGISGLTAALEAADTGYRVALVEKNSFVGGRVAQLNQYFPKLCPPTCGLEINLRRLRESSNTTLFTLSEVKSVSGEAGDYRIEVRQKPRYVNNKCTLCGDCEDVCPAFRMNDFNYNMNSSKAIYYPYNNAYPQKYAIDMKACKGASCSACVTVCRYKAIDLNEAEKTIILHTKSIIWATGWKPYDAAKLTNLGFGKYKEVITNVMMERLAAPNGPTQGQIFMPGMQGKIEKVAFVQCAGSRDENHLEYCSSVCCLASMKQARYIREQYPEAELHIFYIDLRAQGLLEDFYRETKTDPKIFFHRGKAAKVFKSPLSGKMLIEAEDTLAGELNQFEVDLVVLATGMQPAIQMNGYPYDDFLDENGFIKVNQKDGIIACGVTTAPKDVAASVREATGAALRAIQIIRESN